MRKEILRLEYITKTNKCSKILQNICINLFQGEIVKLVGRSLNGAEELIKILGGISLPDYGNVYIDGKEVSLVSPKVSQESGIGIVSQQGFPLYFTVREGLLLGTRHPVKKFFSFDKNGIDRIDEILSLLGINVSPDALIGDIKADAVPLIYMGNVLIKTPKIVIIDHLQNTLNHSQEICYKRILSELPKRNIGVLIFSSDVDIFTDIVERVYVLQEGCIVGNIKIEMYDKHKISQAIESEAVISSN